MGEIIVLHLGGTGNRVGSDFWKAISQEHCVDPRTGSFTGSSESLRERLDVYYEDKKHNYIPRAVLVDLDHNEDIEKFPHKDGVVVSADGGMSGNFSRGVLAEGEELFEEVSDKLREIYERCDRLQGCQIIHSLGGGTGGGMGALLVDRIKQEVFPDRIVSTFTFFTNFEKKSYPTEPYNHVLAIRQICEDSDMTFCFENDGISEKSRAYDSIIPSMTGATSALRFPTKGMSCMRQFAVDLAPFPRLHFLTIGSTINARSDARSVPDLAKAAFDNKFFSLKSEPSKKDALMAADIIFAGKVQGKGDMMQDLAKVKDKNSFVDWVPNNLTGHLIKADIPGGKTSATLLANPTSLKQRFEKILKEFNKLYDKKEGLQTFLDGGMDEVDIEEAAINMKELISDYDDCIEGKAGDVSILKDSD